jgi:hypothetical protein
MIEFALASALLVSQTSEPQYDESVNKVCSYIVGIPYASDNFNDSEWERFQVCRKLINAN